MAKTHDASAKNAMVSKVHGVITVRSMDAAPAVSTEAAVIMARRIALRRPRMPMPLHMSDTSETARPAAAMPCASESTDRGIIPRITRCAPTAATETRSAVEVRRPTSARMPTRMTAPYVASSVPTTMSVALNTRPEKSSNVPSCE